MAFNQRERMFTHKYLILLAFIVLATVLHAKTIVFSDTSITTKSVYKADSVFVHGDLEFRPANGKLSLQTHYLYITGRITVDSAYVDSFKLDLGDHGELLVVGGELNIRGHARQQWTNTSGDATSTYIPMTVPNGWDVGDSIVIAPTEREFDYFEERRIDSIDAGGIYVNTLSHDHAAGAYIANYSSSFLVTGSSWHLIATSESELDLAYTEFARGGVYATEGKYPIHLHHNGDSYTSRLIGNIIHHSNNRGYVLHRSDGATVIGNVLYDHPAHGYVIGEDGFTKDSYLYGNLGMKTFRAGSFAFPTSSGLDNRRISGGSVQEEAHPMTYWITAYDNTLINNHAVGGKLANGFGFDGSMGRPGYVFEANTRDVGIYDSLFAYYYDEDTYDPWGLFASYRFPGTGLMTDQFRSDTLRITNLYVEDCKGGAWIESDFVILDEPQIIDCDYGVLLDKGIVLGGVISRSSSPEDLGAFILKHSEAQPPQKGPFAIRDPYIAGYSDELVINDGFEGPGFISGINKVYWASGESGVLFNYDSRKVYVDGTEMDSNTVIVWADDSDSCTSFSPGTGWWTLQEYHDWWTSCSYPWAKETHWVSAQTDSMDTPDGAESIRVFGFPETSFYVDEDAVAVEQYGFVEYLAPDVRIPGSYDIIGRRTSRHGLIITSGSKKLSYR